MKQIILKYLKPYYGRMTVGFFIKFTGTIMDLLLPWTLAHMIDSVIPTNGRKEILLWGLFMVVCSVLAVTFNILANRMASRVASDAIFAIRGDLFTKVMHLPEAVCDEITRPSLMTRLTSDTYHVHQMLGRVQRLGVRAPILLIGGIVMTMILDPVLACILLATLPLLTLVIYLVSKKSIPMFGNLQKSVDQFVQLVREDISGIRVIKALSKEDYERRRFDQINRKVAEGERQATMITAVTNPTMNVLLNLGLVSVIVVGAYRVNLGLTEVGKILAFMTYFTIILHALLSISRMFVVLSKAVASAGRIMEVLDQEEERGESFRIEKEDKLKSKDHITCSNVSFSYNQIQDNLQKISFSLKRGETLGIIGATGSGKTTIINLLLRMYHVDKGSIAIDGIDIQDMDLHQLRGKFGVVFQNDVIFENSIKENIRIGRNLSTHQIQEGILYSKSKEFVAGKGGIQAHLDIKGANLSGGEKQRILIARALAAHPEILILDDSSSALDYKTDLGLRNQLKEHFSDTTCVIVTQRISSVMHADQILVLEEGRIIGHGTHQELLKTCQTYGEIQQSQMGITPKEVMV